MKQIHPRLATERELRLFHADYYVNYLKRQDESDEVDDDDEVDDEQLEYGIGECSAFILVHERNQCSVNAYTRIRLPENE